MNTVDVLGAYLMSTMEDLSREVDVLTDVHLTIVLQGLATLIPNPDADFLTYGLATEVLRFFFGNAWTNESVFSQHKEVSPQHRSGRAFLRAESTDEDNRFRHHIRVIKLAETVFNLQRIEGLKDRIALMQNHDLESAFGEMECAALFSEPSLNLRFVTPKGVKGEDYEGEVTTPSGRVVRFEIKSKSERIEPDAKTLWRTFDDARKQLPKDKPGIILAKIPEAWGKPSHIVPVVNAAVARVCRQSDRIVAVVILCDDWHTTPEGWRLVQTKVKSYANEMSSLYDQDVEALLSKTGSRFDPKWLPFQAFVEKVIRMNFALFIRSDDAQT